MVKACKVKIVIRKAKKRRGFCGNKGKKNKVIEQSVKTANNDGNKDVNIDDFVNNNNINMKNFKQVQQFETEKSNQYVLSNQC